MKKYQVSFKPGTEKNILDYAETKENASFERNMHPGDLLKVISVLEGVNPSTYIEDISGTGGMNRFEVPGISRVSFVRTYDLIPEKVMSAAERYLDIKLVERFHFEL